MNEYVLTFDLGTTRLKAALFDAKGQTCGCLAVSTPSVAFADGRCEMSPESFLVALDGLVASLHQFCPDAWKNIKAITLAVPSNTFVLLDESHQPLTPIILWKDQRHHDMNRLKDQENYLLTGVPEFHFEFMAAKLLWFQQYEPALYRRIKHVWLIGDYVNWLLTSQAVTDGGSSGLTGLLDIHQLTWRTDVMQALGFDPAAFPRPMWPASELGPITAAYRQAWQLPADCRFVLGYMDQYAGALGAGVLSPDQVVETTGTVLSVVRPCRGIDPNWQAKSIFVGPGYQPGTYYRMRFGHTSANRLEEYRRDASVFPSPADYDWLNAQAQQAMDTPEPSGNPIGQRVLSIYRQVAQALDEQLRDVMKPGETIRHIRSVGGASRSDLWLSIKAQTTGLEVQAINSPEPTSLGAAMLVLARLSEVSLEQTIRALVHVRRRFHQR